MNGKSRIDFLDTLKVFIILMVIALHTSSAYAVPRRDDWVYNPLGSTSFWLINFVLESGVMMPIMFFISGYFILPSMLKRSAGEFAKGKLVHLGLPYAFGVFVLTPTLAAMSYYSLGGTLPLWRAVVQNSQFLFHELYHFWYLGVLLVFTLMAGAVYAVRGRSLVGEVPTICKPSRRFFPAFVVGTALACFGLNLVFHYGDWANLYILHFQVVKTPLYIGYFLLGMYAYRNRWFTDGYRPRLLPWAPLYVVSLVLYLAVVGQSEGDPRLWYGKLSINLVASVEVLAALMALLALFQRLPPGEQPFLRRVSSVSYSAYIVHLDVVFAVVLVTASIAMAPALKYTLQVILIPILVWGIALLWQRLSGGARRLTARFTRVMGAAERTMARTAEH